MDPLGSGRAGGVSSGVVVPAVGTVGRGSRAAVSDRAEVTLFRTGGIGAAVFRLSVVEGADRADRVIVFADWGSVSVSLTIAAASGFVGGVGDFDFPFTGEKEDVGAHLLAEQEKGNPSPFYTFCRYTKHY